MKRHEVSAAMASEKTVTLSLSDREAQALFDLEGEFAEATARLYACPTSSEASQDCLRVSGRLAGLAIAFAQRLACGQAATTADVLH